jgi:triacylglycerol lipase
MPPMKDASLSPGPWPPIWREARFGLEVAALMRDPVFRGRGVSPGKGRPVMLIPGFLAGDTSLVVMSGWLRRHGYRTHRAGMVANVDCSGAAMTRLERRLEGLVEQQERPAVLIGQSRGGGLARALAIRRPELVSALVVLGSPQLDPFAIHPFVRLQVRAVSGLGSLGVPRLFKRSCLDGDCCAAFWEEAAAPLGDELRFVSIYSKSDGIVDWRACLDPQADNVEVGSSHCGMAVNAAVFRAVAAALSDLEAERPSRPQGNLRAA